MPYSNRKLIRERARALFEQGFWVVPCNPDDGANPKAPIWTDWQSQRRSLTELDSALSNGRVLNIAVVWDPTNLMDVEYDTEAGKAACLEIFGGEIPETVTYDSPRGRHHLFLKPADLPARAVIEIDGVEFRYGNCLSVLPPSRGRKYLPGKSFDETNPAELPADVADRLRAAHNPPKRAGSEVKNKHTSAEKLMIIATTNSELWHTTDTDAYASIRRDGHREHWPIRSKGFRQWLAKRYHDEVRGVVGGQTLQDVQNALEGKAVFDGPEYPAPVRVAEYEGAIYVDMADACWRALKIDVAGWEIVDNPPVRFRRPSRSLSMPEPARGGSIDDLRPFLNVRDADWPLVVAFIVELFRPFGPKPILKLLGEHGTAKTTSVRAIRSIVDPNTAPHRGAPHNERDLMIASINNWVPSFDNLSFLSADLCDALCRLATGGGFGTRTLYENSEETVFYAVRPIILTGIEDIGTRADLLDRSLIVELLPIDEKDRLAESEFNRRFDTALPKILGAFLDAVSLGLKNLPAVQKRDDIVWPRMADFAQWVIATEPCLGLEPGTFLEAYAANRQAARQTVLDSSPIVPALRALLKRNRGRFKGTAARLLDAIGVGQDTKARGWPKTARPLAGMLTRLAPDLRRDGITIEKDREGNDKVWRIESDEIARTQSTVSTQKPNANPKSIGVAQRLREQGVQECL